MKKIFVAILFAAAVVGGVQAVNLTMHHNHQHSVDCGVRCIFCNGSGFNGNFNCTHCNGTGRNSAY